MARLVHNDYLEQASDSGVVGFLSHAVFVLGTLAILCRREWPMRDRLRFGVWLGLFGWALQALVEFPLYIPALAWPAFVMLGWLAGTCTPKERIHRDVTPA
jgi:O-antigen ligase